MEITINDDHDIENDSDVSNQLILNKHLQELQITCEYSDEKFENILDLFKHKQINKSFHSENPKKNNFKTQCFNCPLQFDSLILNDGCINIHKSMPGLESSCNFCEKNFSTKRSFYHYCYICNTSSVGNCKELAHHLKTIHKSRKPYPCIICNSIYISVSNLRIHIRQHTGERPFSCNNCTKKFSRPYVLKRHLKSCLCNNVAEEFHCSFCKRQFSSLIRLKTHLKSHEKAESKEYKCSFCEMKFTNPINLKQHLYTHSVEPTQCKICKKKLSTAYTLIRHLKLHNKIRSKPYKCDSCGKDFAEWTNLKQHQYTHQMKAFDCNVCKKKYSSPMLLKRHQKVHERKI